MARTRTKAAPTEPVDPALVSNSINPGEINPNGGFTDEKLTGQVPTQTENPIKDGTDLLSAQTQEEAVDQLKETISAKTEIIRTTNMAQEDAPQAAPLKVNEAAKLVKVRTYKKHVSANVGGVQYELPAESVAEVPADVAAILTFSGKAFKI